MNKSKCFTCDTNIDENTIYCENCYKQLCFERKNLVNDYVRKGFSFKKACEIVANEYEIDQEDVKFLFSNSI